MRQVVLDTETTGLEPSQGHRIIEIGCVELLNRRLTGRRYHQYLYPDRAIDAGAIEVHGITNEHLADKPRFPDVAAAFLDFIKGAELIIHNAAFDVGFINHELARVGADSSLIRCLDGHCTVLDSLALARRLHPGQKNNLDALCRRYNIDNSQRDLHGALLDAEILADVYLAMTGGQATLFQDTGDSARAQSATNEVRMITAMREPLAILRASDEELDAHRLWVEEIDKKSGGRCIWKRMDDAAAN